MNEEMMNVAEETTEAVIDQVRDSGFTTGQAMIAGAVGGAVVVAVTTIPKAVKAIKNKFFGKKDLTKEDFEVLDDEAEEVSE